MKTTSSLAAGHARSSVHKLRIAIIGCRFGRHMAHRLLADPDHPFEIASVCDLDSNVVAPLATELGVPGLTNHRAILDDPSIDAVAVFTGPHGRAAFLREIIRAGKDVMTTKPFELDPDAAAEVLEEARQLGRVIHLNSPAVELPADLALIDRWRAEYDLGRPVYFLANTHISYNESADGSWYDDPARCPAAPILRIGVYLINDITSLLGDVAAVALVESRIRTGRPTPDTSVLSLRLADGCLGAIAASFCVDDGDRYRISLQVSFERGTISRNFGAHLPDRPGQMEVSLVGRPGGKRTMVDRAILPIEEQTDYRWDAFADAILRRKPASHDYARRIVAGVRAIALMREAALARAGLPGQNAGGRATTPTAPAATVRC